MPKHPHTRSDRKSFGQRTQDFGYAGGGRLEPIEGRVAPGGAGGPARLTAKRLDPLGATMRAIPDEGVDGGVGDAVVGAGWVGTGEAIRGDALGGTTSAFELASGTRRWRCRCRRARGRRQAGQSSGGRGLSKRWWTSLADDRSS